MTGKTAKRVVLGITGGIAAYKTAELTRLLKKAGIDVQVVMTDAATQFITPVTMQALSGNPVFVNAWDDRIANNMGHIELSRNADAILVAPATADFLAKLANGFANDLLSTLCIARQPTCPLLVAPAMNREMWENPATQRNVAQLITDGVVVLGPDAGDQACGDTGMGRMLEPDVLLGCLKEILMPASRILAGKRALVTAGPTFEPIDPVRGITNRSSGKMGYAIAEALKNAGADVVLVSGPTSLPPPSGVKNISIKTSSQMFDEVKANLKGVDLFFAVAAVADYTPATPKTQKIKKSTENMTIDLIPTVDILSWVASQNDAPFCVGFAAESENVVEYARKKREKKQIPMIVANSALEAIGSDSNRVTIIDEAGDHALTVAHKAEVARQIVSHAANLFLSGKRNQPVGVTSPALKSVKNA
ncbi:MAG: bifunctional phosphopantothenoylcysteine decarboxylase/phosphopantothenate--cysteine ligase CoaBC [Betaproteobacteria bacterium]|nr:bifunctional phosphopantothenoylcysteine decarboxylase/phosphopantothenate--cysteine ligase CoaBC [Betaproteobacteria bacterium]